MQTRPTLYLRTSDRVRRYTGGITDDGFMDDGTPIEDVAPWIRSAAALTDAQALAVFARIERLDGVGAVVDVDAIVSLVLQEQLPAMSDTDFAILGFDCASSLRSKYDYLIDLMEGFKCFEGMDGLPCMFESYGTLVNFKALPAFVDAFGRERTQKAIEVLRECEFTPLASLVGTYLGYCLNGWAEAVIAAGEANQEPALAD